MCICMFEISFLGTMGPSHCPLAMSWLGHPYPTVIIVVQIYLALYVNGLYLTMVFERCTVRPISKYMRIYNKRAKDKSFIIVQALEIGNSTITYL